MSLTYKLNKHCPKCGCRISDKNKSGYCNLHRDRTGINNPFYGKHHTKESLDKIKDICKIRSEELWKNDDYRQRVITNMTGKTRSNEFKEKQRQNAIIQYQDVKQKEIRSEQMKEKWKEGKIQYSNHYSPNFSKEQISFEQDLMEALGDNAKNLETKVTLSYKDTWIFPDLKYNNFIIEYNGDFWHANPKKYKSDDVIHHNITASEIWEHDKLRKEKLTELGYEIIEVWSGDYKENKNKILNEILEKLL